MAFNLAKKYPELLEIMHYNEFERKKSLRAIFDRDITDNDSFKFNDKQIRPTKKDGEIDLENVLHHITTEEVEITEENKKIKKRIFEKYRSMRLHWIKPHIELSINDKIEYFSIIERDEKKSRCNKNLSLQYFSKICSGTRTSKFKIRLLFTYSLLSK